jgi:hypothetical protein
MLMLPFAASIPKGVKVYTIADDLTLQEQDAITVHQPVLVVSNGDGSQSVTFTGSGDVAFARSALDNQFRGSYVEIPLYAGDYMLGQVDGQWGWKRLTAASELTPFDVYAQIKSQEAFIPIDSFTSGITGTAADNVSPAQYYDLQGRRIISPANLSREQVIIMHTADGKVRKMVHSK